MHSMIPRANSIALMALFLCITASSQWSAQPSDPGQVLLGVQALDENTGVAVGTNGRILRTTSGGTQWTIQPSNTTRFLRDVYFPSPSMGFTVGELGIILRTTNGGVEWSAQASNTTSTFVHVHFFDTSIGTAVGLDGVIRRTTNGGTAWAEQTSTAIVELTSVHFVTADIGTIVGFGGLIMRTTNGGTNWIQQTSGTTNALRGVFFTGVNNGITVGIGGVIRRTTNGGANWNTVTVVPQPGDLYAVHFMNSATGFAVGHATILRTSDAGATWTSQPSAITVDLYAVDFSDVQRGWAVGQNGTILRTTNSGGATDVEQRRQGLPQGYILNQNYPNPFNPSTRIEFSLPRSSYVSLKVFDVLGQQVTTLVEGNLPAGNHIAALDASMLPVSGVYFYRLHGQGVGLSRRMILIK